MRIELIYAPGCNSYRKALDVLETIIAEERLPIPIEMLEENGHGAPRIRINGLEFGEHSHTFEGDPCGLEGNDKIVGSGQPCSEQLRHILSGKWKEHSLPAY